MIIKHQDESGRWRRVDALAVTREIWGIPPDVEVEEFDFESAEPPEISEEEMARIIRKHYVD